MTTRTSRRWPLALATAACGLAALGGAGLASANDGGGDGGAVYVETNAAAGNAVQVFGRASDGSLRPGASYATGGLGTGAGLGSQGALALDDETLLAVDAGSNDIAVFRADDGRLRRTDIEPSGGERPISVTVHDGLVYVLNAGGTGNVTGFRLRHGDLTPLAGSSRPLSTGASAPAQVAFSPDGRTVVVTEKATNAIDGFPVGRDGRLGTAVVTASSGQTPFGFAFDRRGRLFVSEAFGGAPGASALSSYGVARSGALGVLSGTAPTLQTAACWVAVTESGRYAYVTNTGSDSITGYSVSPSGALALLNPSGVTATTGRGPTDVALSRGSHHLYALGGKDGSISGFRVRSDGGLTPVSTTSVLPASAVGLVAD